MAGDASFGSGVLCAPFPAVVVGGELWADELRSVLGTDFAAGAEELAPGVVPPAAMASSSVFASFISTSSSVPASLTVAGLLGRFSGVLGALPAVDGAFDHSAGDSAPGGVYAGGGV